MSRSCRPAEPGSSRLYVRAVAGVAVLRKSSADDRAASSDLIFTEQPDMSAPVMLSVKIEFGFRAEVRYRPDRRPSGSFSVL